MLFTSAEKGPKNCVKAGALGVCVKAGVAVATTQKSGNRTITVIKKN
ncbi:hypothetical protein LQZ18_03230 [Lachnospiraceae bacterium ZAX-1]